MAYQFNRITVLVVEDNQPMLEITKSLLITFGIGRVIGAPNGDAGFRYAREYDPDIIIADWMMEPMDGIAFTKLIRTDPNSPNPFVPVILMTSFSERQRVYQARDAGVTEFLVKPFKARDLYNRIAQVIERPRQFVKSDDFFGPDRRRHNKRMSYNGPMRREQDLVDEVMKKQFADREAAAHEKLRAMRDDYGLEKGDAFYISVDNNPSPRGKGR